MRQKEANAAIEAENRPMTDNGGNPVNPCRRHSFNYDPLAWANAIRRVSGLIVMALVLVPLVWLDQAKVQIVGYVLFPIEYALNAALFPGVTTPLRGNGTALLILAPTLALLALVFAALRSFNAFARAAFHHVIGRLR